MPLLARYRKVSAIAFRLPIQVSGNHRYRRGDNRDVYKRQRLDGRRTDEIRPIWCEVGYLPAAHGWAIFTRGETQSLTTVTLGTKMDEKVKDEVLVPVSYTHLELLGRGCSGRCPLRASYLPGSG